MNVRRLASYGPAFVLLLSLLACWEVYTRLSQISVRLLPPPTLIMQALIDNWGNLSVNTLQTLLETVLGLATATVLGLLLAILLDVSPATRRAVYPLLVTSQTIPMVALAPLLVLWFGFDLLPKLIVVTLYCFFPIAVACADGLLSTDPDLLRLMRSMQASRWQVLRMVRLPGAMPSFFSGLRIAVTYSMTGAIVAEYIAAYQGLGVYMKLAANSGAIVLVFAGIVVTAVLSLLLFGLVSLIERIALPWYQGATASV